MSSSNIIAGHDIKVLPYNIRPVELKITKEINEHARIRLKAMVPEGEKDKYVKMTQSHTLVEVCHTKEGSVSTVLFKGIVTNIDVKSVRDIYYLELEALSCTFDMDLKLKKRSFQNKDMLYTMLIGEVIHQYPRSDFIDEIAKEKKLEKFIVQYDETDWEFLKRMASHFNAGLIPDALSDTTKFWFGKPTGSERGDLENYNFSVNKEIEWFRRSSENFNEGIEENDFVYYTIEADEIFNIGDSVNFQNKKLYVKKSTAAIIGGILKHEYMLAPEKGLSQNRIMHQQVLGASIEGKVIDIKEDQVRLHLDIDEQQQKAAAYWFPYSTAYSAEGNTGWYCMPELNDSVKLYFPTNKEEDGVVINSIRRRSVGGDFITDPDKKIFRTRFGKEIMFDKNEIVITGKDDEILIRLIEDKGIEIYSKKDVRIIADRNIIMESGKTVQISAESGIGLKCKESKLEMDGTIDIQGKQVKTN
ncbi:MAG: hypothetical protein N2645_04070 [Clostridia bacterium]|nr:hypothetical protein [Clostridia bacterium]